MLAGALASVIQAIRPDVRLAELCEHGDKHIQQ